MIVGTKLAVPAIGQVIMQTPATIQVHQQLDQDQGVKHQIAVLDRVLVAT